MPPHLDRHRARSARDGGTGSGRENGYAILARLIERPASRRAGAKTPQYRPAYRGAECSRLIGAVAGAPSDTDPPRAKARPLRRARRHPRVATHGGAAEDLLVAFRKTARAVRSSGETSAGSTGQTLLLSLARGWRLRVTVTRDAFPDGTEFGRTGIAPELPVAVRVADVLAGRDRCSTGRGST